MSDVLSIGTLTYPGALAVAFALMFLTTFSTLLGVRRRLREQDGNLRRLAELVIERDHGPVPRDEADLSRLEGELDNVNARLRELIRGQLEQCKISGSRSLTEATACAREGLPADEIAARCGISKGEAELLARLHGPQRTDAR